MKIKSIVRKVGDCFYLRIPKPYIEGGNIKVDTEYWAELTEAGKEIEQKTQEILTEMTKNANKTNTT
ncbi:hypothetical protein HYX00_01495 [Candidatus Woesearchaeota archaeon]|nr:hypothetical protein [Candidatus Woesearchaeota archaeon]